MIDTSRPRFTAWRLLVWGGALALLAFPLVGMQFTDEIRSTPASQPVSHNRHNTPVWNSIAR